MVIKSGKPTIVSAGSTDLGLAIAETTPNSIAVTNVLSNILSQFDDGCVMVCDPQNGKVYAASPSAKRAALLTAIEEGDVLFLDPDDAQSGRSLMFSATAGNSLAGISVADLTTAVKPKFTVESLVARLLTKIQEREAAVPADANTFFIVVDQVNKKVGIVKSNDPATSRTELNAVTLNAANAEEVKLTLTPDAEESSSNPLPFEGGAV